MEFNINKQISLLNRKLYNKRSRENYSPIGIVLSQMPDKPYKCQPRTKSFIQDDSIKTDHIVNKKKIQIVKLPKLPFGKHQDYNEEEPFVQSHFVEMEKGNTNNDLADAVKKLKFLKKKQNKYRQVTPDSMLELEEKKNHYIYKTKGGVLVTEKDRNAIESYELSKKGRKKQSIASHKLLTRNNYSFITVKSQRNMSKSPVGTINKGNKDTATQMHEIFFFKFKSIKDEVDY